MLVKQEFRYETPAWGAKLICCVYAVLASALLIPITGNLGPPLLQYGMALLASVFLFVALRPSNWRGWLYFKANEQGLYFPTQHNHNDFYHVPWGKVGLIQTETLYSRTKGITIELSIDEQDISAFFSNANKANKFLGIDNKRNGNFVVAYKNKTFQKVSEVALALNKLKSAGS